MKECSKCAFKLIQYGAIGIASVADDVGGNREVVVDGETGFVCRRPDAWRRALERLIAAPELCDALGRNAGARIAERYSIQVNYAALRDAIESTAAAPTGRAARAGSVAHGG